MEDSDFREAAPKLRGDNVDNVSAFDYSKLHVYPWKYPREWAWISQRPDWLETIFRTRQYHGYNNLMIITGPLGGGKSSTAIR